MQTIINPYNEVPKGATPEHRRKIMAMHNAFNIGVKAAQQAPIVKKLLFEIGFSDDYECTVFGYCISISTQEDTDSLEFSCHYVLKIYNASETVVLEEVSEDMKSLLSLALEFLSDLVTTELGHPVKFVLD